MSTTAWRRILAATACIQHLPVTPSWPRWSTRESQRRSRSSGRTLLGSLRRVEAFNAFNHTNFQAPTNNFTFGGRLGFNQESPGTAGLLDSTATPSRQVQIGAKVIF